MNKIIIEILPDIDHLLNGVTKDVDQQNEIRQELILKVYDNEQKVRKMIENNESLKGWLFIVARSIYIKGKKGPKTTELDPNMIEEIESHYVPNIKTPKEMLQQLTETERLWIKTWVECNFNCSELERVTRIPGIQKGIDRRSAKTRIDTILEKWKQSDIYLQELL